MAEYEKKKKKKKKKVHQGWPDSGPAFFLHSWLKQKADRGAVNITQRQPDVFFCTIKAGGGGSLMVVWRLAAEDRWG